MSAKEDDKAEREAYIRGAKDTFRYLVREGLVIHSPSWGYTTAGEIEDAIDRGEWPPKEKL